MLLACVCVLAVATTAVAAVGPTRADTTTTNAASGPQARAAGDRLQARYRRVRHRLERHIPRWGKQHLRSIAWCESRNNPRAIGGGGSFRGLYQFTFSTWRAVGGWGDPAAAPRTEQTWRAWVLLKNEGSGHWPVCG